MLSIVGFAIMNAAGKEAAKSLSFWQVADARAAGGAVVALAYAFATGVSVRVHNRGIMALRTATGASALASTFYALAHAPLAESVALFNLSPVFIAALAPWLLAERFERRIGACLLVALGGMFLVARPSSAGLSMGHLAALAAAVLAALSMISLRKLGESESPEGVVVWFQAVTAVVLTLLGGRTFRWPGLREGVLLLICAGAGTFGQLMMTRAYAKERAARVGALSYLQIPASVLLGVIVFHEVPSGAALAGIGLILLAGGGVVAISSRGEKENLLSLSSAPEQPARRHNGAQERAARYSAPSPAGASRGRTPPIIDDRAAARIPVTRPSAARARLVVLA